MDLNGSAAPRRGRGRVVMLVDNGVQGDSRVQKTARSAAEAGWEVILLGVLGQSGQECWRIGDAEVRLIRVARGLGQHPIQFRRSLLRRPLAYPPGRLGNYRIQRAKAWQADLDARRAALEVDRRAGRGRWRELVGKSLLVPSQVMVKALGRWAKFRAGELFRLRRSQRNPGAPLTRLNLAFWRMLRGNRSWRRLDPGLWDYELAFGPVIDKLQPDLIHAHDFRMIGVGVRATLRARAKGQSVKLVWDAHEFIAGVLGRPDNPRWLPAQVAYVAEYAPSADAVITVSRTLAELLQQVHSLPVRPDVVLNAPVRHSMDNPDHQGVVPDLRALCGVDVQTPLLVYCGGVNPVRGVDLMLDALPSLPGAHVALVTLHPNGHNAASEELRERAAKLGVLDRVHLLPYVPYWQVASFLAAADIGVIPIHHQPNHELALITKFFEYSHARLPIVVSDVRAMAEATQATGQGEVFRVGDLADYLRAVRAVLADPERYRAAYDRPGLLEQWTWEAQAEVLDSVYSRLLSERPAVDLSSLTDAGLTEDIATSGR